MEQINKGEFSMVLETKSITYLPEAAIRLGASLLRRAPPSPERPGGGENPKNDPGAGMARPRIVFRSPFLRAGVSVFAKRGGSGGSGGSP